MTNNPSNVFSATYFMSTVSGSSGGEYAAWFFDQVREYTTQLETRLEQAIEFNVSNVAEQIREAARGLAVLQVMLGQLEGHCRNVSFLKTSLGNASRRISGILAAHADYIRAAEGHAA